MSICMGIICWVLREESINGFSLLCIQVCFRTSVYKFRQNKYYRFSTFVGFTGSCLFTYVFNIVKIRYLMMNRYSFWITKYFLYYLLRVFVLRLNFFGLFFSYMRLRKIYFKILFFGLVITP